MSTNNPKTALSASTAGQRLTSVDALRGFALLGILMVNMYYFGHPVASSPPVTGATTVDRAAAWLIQALFEGKFFPIFSLLFGLGISLQRERADASGRRFAPLFLRRMVVLLLFGVAHGVLLWVGDILTTYALLGLLILAFFTRRKPRTLWTWAIALMGTLALVVTLSVVGLELARATPAAAAEVEADMAAQAAAAEAENATDYQVYSSGSYARVTAHRAAQFANLMVTSAPFSAPGVLAMMLIGMAMGANGRFSDIRKNRAFFRQVAIWCLPIGLAAGAVYASSGVDLAGSQEIDWRFLLGYLCYAIGGKVLAMGYVSLFALICARAGESGAIVRLLAPAGRMALTNYLMHSIVWTTVFYGYGFGLYGSVGAALGMLLTVVTFVAGVAGSSAWLSRFRHGPFEWLWRRLTYRRTSSP